MALSRGGTVRVCSTSGLHVTAGKSASGTLLPLMLALDRGAVEVQMAATTSDVVMTPDLRFTMGSEGPLDLRLRVTSNGDTCVENRGASAPVLRVADPFGGATYELRAGQHVLFEHGSLKEVVDHESSPCGCPPMPVVSVADAGMSSRLRAAAVGSAVAAKTAEEQHPFPAAVSAGLAPAAAVPQAPAGSGAYAGGDVAELRCEARLVRLRSYGGREDADAGGTSASTAPAARDGRGARRRLQTLGGSGSSAGLQKRRLLRRRFRQRIWRIRSGDSSSGCLDGTEGCGLRYN